ncbi:MAG: YegS/Rv2252/BmrU family lipid kinase [Ferruginibacter sp.]
MKRKIAYFINPISGTKSKESIIKMIEEQSVAKEIGFRILETRADGNYDFLPALIVQEGFTDIVICGGDGSVNQVTSYLLQSDVKIGIIPMGSGNGLALAAGITTHSRKALEIIFNDNAAYIDAFYINNHFSCMLCGLGFDAKVAHDFAKQKKRGVSMYVKQTIKNFLSAIPYPFVIKLNDLEIKEEAFFISIANSNQFGNQVTIAPLASLSDGFLDIVIVKKMSKLRLLYAICLQIKMGQITNIEKKFRQKDIFYFQTKQLLIENPNEAPLHIDGDPATTARNFNIRVVEKAFKLLQPSLITQKKV